MQPAQPKVTIRVDRTRIRDNPQGGNTAKTLVHIPASRRRICVIVPRSSQAMPLVSPLVSSSFSSLIVAVMPKCPACLVVLLAPLGIEVPGTQLFLAYAILMLAGIPLVFFLSRRCRQCGLRPLFSALGGLAMMTVGRIFFDSVAAMIFGAILMLGAAFWMARLSVANGKCPSRA